VQCSWAKIAYYDSTERCHGETNFYNAAPNAVNANFLNDENTVFIFIELMDL
jgi:hypothetical protein